MRCLVTAETMKITENQTFALGAMPIAVMEYAAAGVTEFICKTFNTSERICVVCGKGNNGGDGLAAARQLFSRGYNVCILPVFDNFGTDNANLNFRLAKDFGVPIIRDYDILDKCSVIIDAIFGIGLSRDAELDIINYINNSSAYVVSVDIPSGICSDTGRIYKNAVRADATVTFGYKKIGLALYPGAEYAGKIIVHDIALKPVDITDAYEPDDEYIASLMKPPKADANKGSFGKLLVIAGSVGMTGAAYLACMGALRCGVGTLTLALPENLNPIMEEKLTEAMTLPLPCNDRITFAAAEKVLKNISSYSAVVIGPGLGKSDEVLKIIEKLIESRVPLVIDADGINSIAVNIDILNKKTAPIVLTPHPGEFSRLTGLSIDEIQKNRLQTARKFAEKYGVTLVLKGAGTVTAMPSGRCYINSTGNAGMATGGSGDVLAGMAGAFLAQNMSESCAVAAVYLHGKAGDIASERLGMRSMLPSDLIDMIPIAFKEI